MRLTTIVKEKKKDFLKRIHTLRESKLRVSIMIIVENVGVIPDLKT